MSPRQASSIVNTAEAIYVLTKAEKYNLQISEGINFIESILFPSIERSGPRTRYVIFALLAMQEHKDKTTPAFIEQCLNWLTQARNKDGGWGHEANDEQSRLFPTCLSLVMLAAFNNNINEIETGFHWIISKKREAGWSFEEEKGITPTATALAVLALREIKDAEDEIFVKPKEFLLETTHWGTEIDNIPGALWEHCTYLWIFPALVSLDVNPYAAPIAEGVRFINELAHNNGWKEPSEGETIRAQFWAVYALNSLQKAFDPAIHIYRIDSERAQSTLSEPEFVNIKIRDKWAMIIPRQTYKLFTYVLFLISVVAFLGLHRKLNSLSRWVDFSIAIFLYIGVYFLVKKRTQLFHPKLLWIIISIVGVFSLVDLLSGYSISDLFKELNDLIKF